ncbi:hypothetical protein DNL40_09990 [Xylanimonas oleitrophica]|uniref:DUF559 domain-containing protein n=1 Tax=Xylanimonas oleitrophica TaxID=2607479 RepID=A0A2W5WPU9_9MICO|nr:DUF559 domain-containing protein [Xylanimonas oleitrophica]PZR52972.1 hypothetical protein DNL40_09990 [Xylanimonas oleitrophica]
MGRHHHPVHPHLPRDRPFAVADAVRAGVPRRALRHPDLGAPFHGVRTTAPPASVLDACRALATVLPDDVVFARTTALRLLGVEVPWRIADDARIHVVARRAQARPERPGVVSHRTRQRSLETVEVHGLLVTSPAQTFVDVACGLRVPDDVVVLGDGFLRRGRALTTVAEMTALAERTRKVKGIVQVREQLPRLRPGTDSSTETRARLALVAGGLPCPVVNEVVRDDAGRYVKRVDMLYRRERVAVEYDGDQHRTDREQWREDVRARRRLEELGWTVVVAVANDVVRDPGPLVARVRSALLRATP